MRTLPEFSACGQNVPGRSVLIAAAVLALFLGGTGAAAAAESVLDPHQALYDLSLVKSKRDSGVVAVEGVMSVEMGEVCEGWTVTYRMAMRMIGASGNVEITSNSTTWETRDGLSYRFRVRNMADGRETDVISGHATLKSEGGPGEAVFEQPEPRKMPLPAGTLFPTRHSEVVLNAAASAPTILSRKVFDGMTLDGLTEINAAISRPLPPGSKIKALADRPSWRIDLAVFEGNGEAGTPDHEAAMRVYDNGVFDDMRMDFGEFSVRATLRQLKILPKPACN